MFLHLNVVEILWPIVQSHLEYGLDPRDECVIVYGRNSEKRSRRDSVNVVSIVGIRDAQAQAFDGFLDRDVDSR